MIKSLVGKLTGASILQKAARTTLYSILNFGSSQLIRLLGNLVLTRILYPEAFGVMALASLLLTALSQFSDIGVMTSIIRSKRGDDPVFLDSAWTLKVIRGGFLFLVACGLSIPMAAFYAQPIYTQIIPVMAVSLVIQGFMPTNIDTAYRNMEMGRLTTLEISNAFVNILVLIALCWSFQSVWGLAIGTAIAPIVSYTIFRFFLPGRRNGFALDRASLKELLTFGVWIFPSTIATFIAMQADKFLLGVYVSMETLGIYNIGFFLASFPMMLAQALGGRVMTAFYKNSPPAESQENFKRIRKLKFVVYGGLSTSIIVLVLIGEWLIEFLYDDRYIMAGVILVSITSMHIVQILQIPYQHAVLGLGKSREYFTLIAIKATSTVVCIWLGLEYFGLLGGIVAQGISMLIAYPASVFYAKKLKVWDPLYDAAVFIIAIIAVTLAWLLYSDKILTLIGY